MLWLSKSPQISSELSPLLEEPDFWKLMLPRAWKGEEWGLTSGYCLETGCCKGPEKRVSKGLKDSH